MKRFLIALGAVFGLLLSTGPALAHVVVKPGQVGVGERVLFTVSVPTEEETPTTGVRLVIPDGLESVRPNVKPGWNIELKKTGEGDAAKITEIIWSGGKIPADQRDDFVFSAKAPASKTTLIWKAYQTYGDGDVVAWSSSPEVIAEFTKNNPPKAGMAMTEDNHDAPRPYSTTEVFNDLTKTPVESAPVKSSGDNSKTISVIALAVAILALILQFSKK